MWRNGEGAGPRWRWRYGLVLVWLAAAAAGACRVEAQEPTRADSAAVLLRAAAELEAGGEREVADAVRRHVLERFAGTPAAARARELLADARAHGVAGSGETELQVWSTTFGLWLGVAVPTALGARSPEPYGVGLLVGGPAGFFGGRGYARSRGITEGQARSITLGGTWGTLQGLGWAKVFDLGEPECEIGVPCFDSGSDEEEFVAMVVGGLAGVVTGGLLARSPVSAGTATAANFGSLWGSWIGFGTAYLGDLEDDDLLAAALVGGNLGLVGGALLGSRTGMTRSRARIVSVAGVVGGLAGAGLDLIFQPDSEKVVVAIPLVGSVVGLAAGYFSTAPRGRDELGQGPGRGALFEVTDGRFGIGAPLPYPTLVQGEGPEGPTWSPGLGMTLFRASF